MFISSEYSALKLMSLFWRLCTNSWLQKNQIRKLTYKIPTYLQNASQGRLRRKIKVLATFTDVVNCKVTEKYIH